MPQWEPGQDSRHMKQSTKIGLIMVVLWLALVWLLTLARPRASASGVCVAFLGYTNSAEGSRFGLFGITNQDSLSIQRVSPGVEVEGMNNLHAPVFNPALPWLKRGPLKSREAEIIAVGLPLDPGRWRLCVRFQRCTIAERLRDYCMSHGHPVPLTWGRFTILGPPQYTSTNSIWLTK